MHKLTIVLAIAGCAQVAQPPVEQISAAPAVSSIPAGIQQAAEQVAFLAIEMTYPQVNPAPVANCVRNNATNGELLTLADGMLHSTTAPEQAMVTTILQRPQARQCVVDNGQVLNP